MRTSAALTGAMRNSSITPLVRSRTSDIATSVTARCWRISASTAGAKYEMTSGVDGAMFTISARVGAAMTSGGIGGGFGLARGDRVALALGGRPPDDLAIDGRRESRTRGSPA